MTTLLQQAFDTAAKLPTAEQDAIAALILEELADEQHWDETFSRSQNELARVAAKVRDDMRAGRVRNAGIDEL